MTTPLQIKRGEIWRVRFDPAQGAEIAKSRPAVIMTAPGMGKLPLQIVVPITGWQAVFAAYPWMVRIAPDKNNNLTKDSAADGFQVKSLSNTRIEERLGVIKEAQLIEITKAIALVIGYVP
jgi:mRNA interferase MazF